MRLSLALILLALPLCAIAQTDPFAGHYLLRDRRQIVAFEDSYAASVRTYDFRSFPGIGDTLTDGPILEYPDSLAILSASSADIVTGNFFGDPFDEIVAAWFAADQSIIVSASSVEQATHALTQRAWWKIPKSDLYWYTGPTVSDERVTHLRLQKGEFDGDGHAELLLAYICADTTLRMILYDTDDGVTFRNVATVADQKVFVVTSVGDPPTGQWVQRFEVGVADLDQDGLDEVLVAGPEPRQGTPAWAWYARVYEPNPSAHTFVTRVKSAIPTHATGLPYGTRIAIAHFDTTRGPECVLATMDNSFYPNLVLARVSADLLSASWGTPWTSPTRHQSHSWFNVATGDLDNNDLSEIVVGSYDTLRVFRAGVDLSLRQIAGKGIVPGFGGSSANIELLYNAGLFVADVNSDSSSNWGPEIVVRQWESRWPSGYVHSLNTYGPVFDSTGEISGLAKTYQKAIPNPYGRFLLVAGRFDHGDVTLGAPTVYSKSDIMQPLVILNAPPIHFDVFGGANYDICSMYDGSPSGFVATYQKQTSSSVEIETKLTRTWAQSNSMKFGFGKFGVGVEANMENRYGHGFSNVDGSSHTIRIGVQVDAIADDYIYATLGTYDLWEYPVYAGGDLIGHVLVVDPNVSSIQHHWFPSKDWNASSYVPNHEVGNILSYPRYAELRDNPAVDELLTASSAFAVTAMSSYQWFLNYSDFQSEQLTKTKSLKTTYALTGGIMPGGIGVMLGGGEEYDDDSISTHTTTVETDLSLRTQLGSVNMGLGEVGYDVTAYTYWEKSGALVLDYAVTPDLPEPGGTPTWWQVRYNKVDPAFILPWRYDKEKGYQLEDTTKRFQTKDITFHPSDPPRSDTVLIVARVRNFGLLNTGVPIAVRFYRGDPARGGTLLVGTDGRSKVTTSGPIPARGSATVQLSWRVPTEIPQYPRIYALINPDTVMDEVHTNNNTAFAVFPLSSLPTGVEVTEGLPDRFALTQNYPNPFNPTTTIAYELPTASDVRLAVYDLLGREVTLLVNERQSAGSHEVWFDAGALATGVYLYRIHADGFVQTRKMLVVK